MKYILPTKTGYEIRQDNYELPENAFELTDDEYEGFLSNKYLFQNKKIVVNPNQDNFFKG